MNIGWLLALLILLAAFVLWLVGQMEPRLALMLGGLALAILCTPFSVKAPWQA